jgi:hypothetical protein
MKPSTIISSQDERETATGAWPLASLRVMPFAWQDLNFEVNLSLPRRLLRRWRDDTPPTLSFPPLSMSVLRVRVKV